jgi:hypothetical protein
MSKFKNVYPIIHFEGVTGKGTEADPLVVDATETTIAAGDDGLDAGTLQEVLQTLATRIQALEDAV